jgi:glycosyltransferase involved in cell wall biosynthesis
VASNTGGIGEVIADKQSGLLINPDNHMTIVAALDYLLKNPDKRSHFADELYQTILSDFSLKQMIEKTHKVYDL